MSWEEKNGQQRRSSPAHPDGPAEDRFSCPFSCLGAAWVHTRLWICRALCQSRCAELSSTLPFILLHNPTAVPSTSSARSTLLCTPSRLKKAKCELYLAASVLRKVYIVAVSMIGYLSDQGKAPILRALRLRPRNGITVLHTSNLASFQRKTKTNETTVPTLFAKDACRPRDGSRIDRLEVWWQSAQTRTLEVGKCSRRAASPFSRSRSK